MYVCKIYIYIFLIIANRLPKDVNKKKLWLNNVGLNANINLKKMHQFVLYILKNKI